MSAIGYTFSFDDLEKKFEQLGNRMVPALRGRMDRWGQQTEDVMRRGAVWTDRTGAARRGLFHDTQQDGQSVTVRLGHTMEYGRYLELSNGGKYAIVMPTIQAQLPALEERLAKWLEDTGE
jgi:hypothetical protein